LESVLRNVWEAHGGLDGFKQLSKRLTKVPLRLINPLSLTFRIVALVTLGEDGVNMIGEVISTITKRSRNLVMKIQGEVPCWMATIHHGVMEMPVMELPGTKAV